MGDVRLHILDTPRGIRHFMKGSTRLSFPKLLFTGNFEIFSRLCFEKDNVTLVQTH